MKPRISGWIILVFVPVIISGQNLTKTPVFSNDSDRYIFQEKTGRLIKLKELPIGKLLLRIGEDFEGTPYVGKTLEIEPEQVVINLKGLDCTTFVETCLAMARIIHQDKADLDSYTKELEKIRYRGGKLNGYTSRLHYFSEWILDNEQKGLVSNITQELGGVPFQLSLDFMSKHPQLYPQILQDSSLIHSIRTIEQKISDQSFYYIPKESIPSIESRIQDGDILAITTDLHGMDIAHTGIAIMKNGRLYMLHASSVHHKVEVTADPLAVYLSSIHSMTGMMVARPL